jgi:hypothetical protein
MAMIAIQSRADSRTTLFASMVIYEPYPRGGYPS